MITYLDWTVPIYVGDVLAPHQRIRWRLVEYQNRSEDHKGNTYWHELSTWSLDLLNLRGIRRGLKRGLRRGKNLGRGL